MYTMVTHSDRYHVCGRCGRKSLYELVGPLNTNLKCRTCAAYLAFDTTAYVMGGGIRAFATRVQELLDTQDERYGFELRPVNSTRGRVPLEHLSHTRPNVAGGAT